MLDAFLAERMRVQHRMGMLSAPVKMNAEGTVIRLRLDGQTYHISREGVDKAMMVHVLQAISDLREMKTEAFAGIYRAILTDEVNEFNRSTIPRTPSVPS